MIEIRCRHYLEKLRRFAETPSIVAVVGLRRVGKSVLLRQFADEARSSQQVTCVDKESFDFADLRTAQDIIRHVNATSKIGEDRLVVLDEVQQIEQWERAVASLNGEPRTRVIISGSNASLFSGELATRIAGRYLTLQVFPLTLADFLGAQRRSVSVDTVLNYLAHLGEAFLLSTVRRYDLKGKRHLETNAKYYLGDIGLRNGVLGYREADIAGLLENLVYLELRRCGYRVAAGSADSRAIDFVAEARSGKMYIQVAYLLESRETIDRELKPFSLLDDAYPRYLLTLDPYQPRYLEGVRHRSAQRFLLGDSLET